MIDPYKDDWYNVFLNPHFIARAALFRVVKEFSEECKSKSVLDVGCGIKPYVSLFLNSEYIGIDVPHSGRAVSSKKPDRYFNGRIIPFSANHFDRVICTEVMEHAFDPMALTNEITRVLKKNGKVLITTPFVWPEHEVPYDFQRFTSIKWQQIIKSSGLHNVSINKTTGAFGTVGQLTSDFLYFEIINIVDSLKLAKVFNHLSKKVLFIAICAPIQIITIVLDKLFDHRGIPLDYVIIAQKNK